MFKHYPDCPIYFVPKHGRFTAQKAASAETFRDSCRAQGLDKRDKPRSTPQNYENKKNFEICRYYFSVHVILFMHLTGQ